MCRSQSEDLYHLLWGCQFVQSIWNRWLEAFSLRWAWLGDCFPMIDEVFWGTLLCLRQGVLVPRQLFCYSLEGVVRKK